MHQWRTAGLVGATIAILASAGSAAADTVMDFFTGKQITMIVPSGVGGGYDLYGRFLARYIGKHIPGTPTVVVKNMPAAGGIGAANHLYSIAAPDGLTMGVFQNTITLNQLGKMSGVKFDVRRLGWIGNMSIASTICALSGTAKGLTAKDLFHTSHRPVEARLAMVGESGIKEIVLPWKALLPGGILRGSAPGRRAFLLPA